MKGRTERTMVSEEIVKGRSIPTLFLPYVIITRGKGQWAILSRVVAIERKLVVIKVLRQLSFFSFPLRELVFTTSPLTRCRQQIPLSHGRWRLAPFSFARPLLTGRWYFGLKMEVGEAATPCINTQIELSDEHELSVGMATRWGTEQPTFDQDNEDWRGKP